MLDIIKHFSVFFLLHVLPFVSLLRQLPLENMGNPWNSPSSPVAVGLCEMKGDRVRGHWRVRREEGETMLNQEWIY